MAYSAIEIANKVIVSTNVEVGETISNLKLQKLLYYLQGFHLVFFKERLFSEDIEAWQYGPVVREVYFHFKDFGSGSISLKEGDTIPSFPPYKESLFKQVMEEYGQFSAVKLMNFTHEELPWKATFNESPGGIIPDALMVEFFKTQVEN